MREIESRKAAGREAPAGMGTSMELLTFALLVLVATGCGGAPEKREMSLFQDAVVQLAPESYDADTIECSESGYANVATDSSGMEPGYFRCWRLSGSVDDAREVMESLRHVLFEVQPDVVNCSDRADLPFRCVMYEKTSGLGPIVFLIGTTHDTESRGTYDIGFGSSNVPVAQVEGDL